MRSATRRARHYCCRILLGRSSASLTSSKVLAVGNPAFDREAFQLPIFPPPTARRVASRRCTTNQSPLIGRDATDAAFERMAPAFDMLHFAGHAVVGRDAPQLSHLVLASEGQQRRRGVLDGDRQVEAAATRLVILSGCNTADGKLSATEGASSLARAFFSAGVPAVVSSLWAIEDDDTADFFIAFHRRLVRVSRRRSRFARRRSSGSEMAVARHPVSVVGGVPTVWRLKQFNAQVVTPLREKTTGWSV